jgi:hypothetical protein
MLTILGHKKNANQNHFKIPAQENKQQQLLVMLQGKIKPCILQVGMQARTTTMENSIEAPQKTKSSLPYNLEIPLLGIYANDCESVFNKGSCIPVFIAALFGIPKLQK